MEAKDTIVALDTKYGKRNPDLEKIQQAQAEISFKAGMEYALTEEGVKASLDSIIKRERLAGIGEMVVAVNTYIAIHGTRPKMFEWWQAKLKEWGIEYNKKHYEG